MPGAHRPTIKLRWGTPGAVLQGTNTLSLHQRAALGHYVEHCRAEALQLQLQLGACRCLSWPSIYTYTDLALASNHPYILRWNT